MIVAQGTIRTGEFAGQHWEINYNHTRGGADYTLTVGGEFYANGDNVFDLMEELEDI